MSNLLTIFIFLTSLAAVVLSGTSKEGRNFLEENKKKPGVVALESGLQYKILKKGTGMSHPDKLSACSFHFETSLIDGTKYDSSYDKPMVYAPVQVIQGWMEAMMLMVEGDRFELYIPSELAYGDIGSRAKYLNGPEIGVGEVLICRLELLEIIGRAQNDIRRCKVTLQDIDNHRRVIKSTKSCAKKEKEYATKAIAWSNSQLKYEKDRLANLMKDNMKGDLSDWVQRRLHILKQFPLHEDGFKEEL